QFVLGKMHYDGAGVAQDYARARHWFEQVAAQGHAQAQFHLGELYEHGAGVARDDVQARRWFEQAAAQHHARAKQHLREMDAEGRGVRQSVELLRCPVAGFQYHQGKTVWHRLKTGALLDLVREPENPHDAQAVRIELEGVQIGYVPRADNAAIAHLMDTGQRVRAHVLELHDSPNPWERVVVSLFLSV
ncbi:MAG: SEL1-like repeat protein, partial [Rhodocyclaceae bacterium]|nr:SEL1-like repeat protein [Rhodocyclaceae bacterium]